MEIFTQTILFIAPTWLIAIVTMLNAILLYKRRNSITYRNYPLHSIALLLMSCFYILISFNHLYPLETLVAMVRVGIIWQQGVWLTSSICDIRGGTWK